MAEFESHDEGAEENVEDLEAPAEAQEDVGGGMACPGKPSMACAPPTCVKTEAVCRAQPPSHDIVVYEQ